MSARSWILVSRWHALQHVTDQGWRTRCGVNVTGSAPIATTLPSGEQPCFRCYRLIARDHERGDHPGVRLTENGGI